MNLLTNFFVHGVIIACEDESQLLRMEVAEKGQPIVVVLERDSKLMMS